MEMVLEQQSNDRNLLIHATPKMKLLPCFNILDFNVGMLFLAQDKSIVPPEQMLYSFSVSIEEIC